MPACAPRTVPTKRQPAHALLKAQKRRFTDTAALMGVSIDHLRMVLDGRVRPNPGNS